VAADLIPSVAVTTPTMTTSTTRDLVISVVPVLSVANPQRRCSSVLGHINNLAGDGEWHCHLPHDHDGVCLAPDGTTW
jgi:hypothetical protein